MKYLIQPTTQMNFGNMPSKRSQSQTVTGSKIPFIWNVQNREMCRDGKQISGCLGLAEERQSLQQEIVKDAGFLFETLKMF